MKKIKIILSLIIVSLFMISTANAQKITVKTGNLEFFKEVSELNIEYDFSDFGVGKFKTEEAYIEEKKADYNEDEPGKGDKWEEEWHADKEETYQPKFEQLFNLVMLGKETGILAGSYTNAEYTMILKTTFLEPGFNIGISQKNAYINVEIVFVKTEDPDNPLAIVTMNKVPGHGVFGANFDTGYRIGEAYAKAGKELANYVWKKVLK
ncbi:MAG: hypothetical protein KAT76_03290 [Bacteroidales bacterium]|nr:hypothetical protein [Bacteroidales bacterium]